MISILTSLESTLLRRSHAAARAAIVITAVILAMPVASGQVLLSDTFDRANNSNLGNFNNALGGTLASGEYRETTATSSSAGNVAQITDSRLDVFGSLASPSDPGKVLAVAALGTSDFSVTAQASSSLASVTTGLTLRNQWQLSLRQSSSTSTQGTPATMLGTVEANMAANGQVVIRQWNSTTAVTVYNANPFTGSTTASNWNVGAPGSLPASINGFSFDSNGDGAIDGSESFLFGARVSGTTLNLVVNGSSVVSVSVPIAAPVTNYAALLKQRFGSTGTTGVSPSMYFDNLVIASATTNSSLAGTAVSGFRVMQDGDATTTVSLANSGSQATAYALGLANASALAVSGSTFGTAAASGTTAVTFGYASTATTGVRSGTMSIANLGTLTDLPAAVSVSGAVVANRTVSASAVNLGNVLVSATTAAQTSTLSTTGNDDNFTRITVSGSQASAGGVTAAAGVTTLFDAGNVTTTRSVTASFGTAGAISSSLNLAVSGEGLAGESVGSVGIAYTATAYDPANLTKVQSEAVGAGGVVSLTNAVGGFRAGGSIASRSVTGDGGWSVAGLAQGTAIAAGATAGGTAAFDSVGKLNGTYLGTLTLGLQNDQSIQGATAGDLGTMNWSLAQVVSGNVGSGTAALAAGRSLAGFSGQSDQALATVASLLAGQTATTTTVTMAFAARPVGSFFSDVLDLHGTDGLAQVLQLSYDPGSLGGTAEAALMLGWKNGSNEWVNAVLGNSGGNPGYTGTSFLGSWADYLAAAPGRTVENSVGAYGVDAATNTAWAAINHNSEFTVIVPEPGTASLLAMGIAGAAWAIRRRRSAA
jgi:hypothetical protein